MEEVCIKCWNDGCKKDKELMRDKVDVCKHMMENPKLWEDDEYE